MKEGGARTDINSSAKIYGLIGYPVKHSLSKVMQEAAFRHYKINAEYRLFEVKPQELQDFLLNGNFLAKDIEGKPIYVEDMLGFNITIPYKIKAKEILEAAGFVLKDSVEELFHNVKISGAVNTVRREDDGQLKYSNTDVNGFFRALREDLRSVFEMKNKNVLLFGCGGAGRAVIAALTWKGLSTRKIYIYDNNEEAVRYAKEHFKTVPSLINEKLEFISDRQLEDVITRCHLLVNASSVGMKHVDPSLIDKDLLAKNKNLSVYDVVYNRTTQLIRDAKDLNLQAADGRNMLLYQGAAAFELWRGREAPIEEMRKALLDALDGKSH